jgi:hypothetical protein
MERDRPPPRKALQVLMVKRRTQLKEDKRIYFIVPETVQVDIPRRKRANTVRMEPGRLAMQAVHVALEMYESVLNRNRKAKGYGQLTAIMLSVRNSRELAKIEAELRSHASSFGIPSYEVYSFSDVNPDLYGINGRVQTAICTTPIEKSMIEPVIGHLERFRDPVHVLRDLLQR